MTILHKFLLTLLLPVSALIGVTSIAVTDRMASLAEIRSTQAVMDMVPDLAQLVHDLQIERGLSVGSLSDPGPETRAVLAEHRQVVDANIARVMAHIETTLLKAADYKVAQLISFAASLEDLDAQRGLIDARALTAADILVSFNRKIDIAQEIKGDLNRSKVSAELGNQIEMLVALARAKDLMGLERAIGTAAFNLGGFDLALYQRYLDVQSQQAVFFAEMRKHASPDLLTAFEALQTSPEVQKTNLLREKARNAGPTDRLEGTTGIAYFNQITNDIDGLLALEFEVVESVDALVEDMAAASQRALIILLALAVGSSGLAVLAAIWIGVRVISKPISTLRSYALALAQGAKVDNPLANRRDEIAQVATVMDVVRDSAETHRRIIGSLQNTSALLMIVTRGRIAYAHPDLVEILSAMNEEDYTLEDRMAMEEAFMSEFEELSQAIALSERIGGRKVVKDFLAGERRFDLLASDVVADDGEDLGIVIEWREVTERRRIEEGLATLLREASEGDFTTRLDIQSDDPLMRSLIDGLNAVCASVDGFVTDLSIALGALAQGDLTDHGRQAYKGQLQDAMGQSDATRAGLADLVTGIRGSSDMLDTKIATLLSGSTKLADQIAQQAQALQQSSHTMSQITDGVERNAAMADETNKLVNQMQASIVSSNDIMSQAVSAIQRIEQGSKAISDIITIIQSIAFQTNLLALNAAVEAARAGEAGAGFAVVASEVRALAQRSSDAAKDIDARIQSSVADVTDGVTIIQSAEQVLEEILKNGAEAVSKIDDMSQAGRHQATEVGAVNQTIGELDAATRDSAEIASQSASAARDMSTEVNQLSDKISRFRLAGDAAQIAAE